MLEREKLNRAFQRLLQQQRVPNKGANVTSEERELSKPFFSTIRDVARSERHIDLIGWNPGSLERAIGIITRAKREKLMTNGMEGSILVIDFTDGVTDELMELSARNEKGVVDWAFGVGERKEGLPLDHFPLDKRLYALLRLLPFDERERILAQRDMDKIVESLQIGRSRFPSFADVLEGTRDVLGEKSTIFDAQHEVLLRAFHDDDVLGSGDTRKRLHLIEAGLTTLLKLPTKTPLWLSGSQQKDHVAIGRIKIDHTGKGAEQVAKFASSMVKDFITNPPWNLEQAGVVVLAGAENVDPKELKKIFDHGRRNEIEMVVAHTQVTSESLSSLGWGLLGLMSPQTNEQSELISDRFLGMEEERKAILSSTSEGVHEGHTFENNRGITAGYGGSRIPDTVATSRGKGRSRAVSRDQSKTMGFQEERILRAGQINHISSSSIVFIDRRLDILGEYNLDNGRRYADPAENNTSSLKAEFDQTKAAMEKEEEIYLTPIGPYRRPSSDQPTKYDAPDYTSNRYQTWIKNQWMIETHGNEPFKVWYKKNRWREAYDWHVR